MSKLRNRVLLTYPFKVGFTIYGNLMSSFSLHSMAQVWQRPQESFVIELGTIAIASLHPD